jgi:transposase
MRYELTDHEWTAIKPMLPNKPRGRGALAGPAQDLRSIHHLLQSLRSLAAGGRLAQDHERAGWRA